MRTPYKTLLLVAMAGCGGDTTIVQSDGSVSGGPFLQQGTNLDCSGTQKVTGLDPATGNVICSADVDTNTMLSQGPGIALSAMTVSVAFADFACPGSDKITGFVAGEPICSTDLQATPTQVPRNNLITTVDSDPNTGRDGSITIGIDGMPVMSYRDGGSADDLLVAKCVDTACIAPALISRLDSTDAVGKYSSIAIGADTFPVVSYYDETNGALKVAKCVDTICLTPVDPQVVDSGGTEDVGGHTTIAIGVDGLPIVSYYDFTNGDLKVAHCTTANCAAGTNTITMLDGGATDVGSSNSLAIGIDGRPVISYYSSSDSNLRVAKCGDIACTLGNVTNVVDDGAAGTVGRENSITIGADGLPVISYADGNSGGLKVVRCANAACATVAGLPTLVDGQGTPDVQDTSITVGTDGLPIIAYHDAIATTLRVAKCGDLGCTTGNTAVTVDSGFVGEEPSITVGTDGRPIIAYRGSNVLNVVQCVNPFCVPYWTRR